jgi:hypothetical protein
MWSRIESAIGVRFLGSGAAGGILAGIVVGIVGAKFVD